MRNAGYALLVALSAWSWSLPAIAEVVPFNSGWEFRREKGSSPSSGPVETVTLPHTSVIEPRIVNDQWQGISLYRKTFQTPASWADSVVLLRFEAAMNVADVSVNGIPIGQHIGGYLPFTFDLTPHLKIGESNELTVRLDNRDNPITGPKPLKELDFNTYGGLYRDVTLLVKPPVHLTDEMLANKVAGGGILVSYPAISPDSATIRIQADIGNAAPRQATAAVTHRLYDGASLVSEVETPIQVGAHGATITDQVMVLTKPKLWSPERPNLYRLETIVKNADGRIDELTTRIGIRSVDFARDGSFRLNGEPVFLRGVNRHQEYPYVGYALSPEADYRDAKLIKSAGFDYVRLSHYPHSPAFLAAADELGLMILDSIPGWQFYNSDPRFSTQVLQTCRDMIRRDRNHPSVLAWECSLNETDMPKALVAELDRTVHAELPFAGTYSAGWVSPGFDIFLQARQHRLQHYKVPDRPYVVSEYGDWEYYAQNAGFAQNRWADLKEEERTSRQPLGSGERRLLQQANNVQEAHDDNLSTPAFADGYWAMFDYNRGYAKDLEHSGLMSIERLPKFAYWFFRSQRGPNIRSGHYESGPMVKIASYWNRDSSPEITVFGNVEEVELRLNGHTIDRRRPERGRIATRLAHPPVRFMMGGFAPGALEAIGYIGGKAVASDVVRTPGAAIAVCSYIDTMGISSTTGDIVFLRGVVLDAQGIKVPENDIEMVFAPAEGWAIVGPDRAISEAGIASILIKAGSGVNSSGASSLNAQNLRDDGSCA